MQQTSRPAAVNLTITWWAERTENRSAEGRGACESIDATAAPHSMDAAVQTASVSVWTLQCGLSDHNRTTVTATLICAAVFSNRYCNHGYTWTV